MLTSAHILVEPITFFTGVSAIAAVAYVLCTVLLWVSTRRAADAAMMSAEAAKASAEATTVAAEAGRKSADAAVEAAEASKKSTDLLAELNRPYMGISFIGLRPDANAQNNPYWDIAWAIENFGTLPALAVKAKIDLLAEDDKSETLLMGGIGPISAEVFPKSNPIETRTVLSWKEFSRERDLVLSGKNSLTAKMTIHYMTTGGTKFIHEAHAEFRRGYGTFSVYSSTTQKL
jgi:hypothetical protein